MNSNKSTNIKEPLFYIIQPVNKSKLITQNMQEIFHSKGSVKEEENKSHEDKATVINEYKEDIQTKDTLEENIDSITEDQKDLQIEETFEEYTDITIKDHLLKGKTNQGEVDLNLDENMEGQVEKDILKDDLRMKLIRLARYPAVVEKPFCEIKTEGETIVGQIESKRGEILKVKVGGKIRLIAIDNIDELSVI